MPCRRGATSGWDGTTPPSRPIGESCNNTELFRRLAAAMGYTEPALFDDDETILAQALARKEARPRRAGVRRVGEGAVPRDGRPRGTACSRPSRAG